MTFNCYDLHHVLIYVLTSFLPHFSAIHSIISSPYWFCKPLQFPTSTPLYTSSHSILSDTLFPSTLALSHTIQIIAISYSADFRIQHGRVKIIFENKNREEQDLRHLVVEVDPCEALTVKTLPPPSTIEGTCCSLHLPFPPY